MYQWKYFHWFTFLHRSCACTNLRRITAVWNTLFRTLTSLLHHSYNTLTTLLHHSYNTLIAPLQHPYALYYSTLTVFLQHSYSTVAADKKSSARAMPQQPYLLVIRKVFHTDYRPRRICNVFSPTQQTCAAILVERQSNYGRLKYNLPASSLPTNSWNAIARPSNEIN